MRGIRDEIVDEVRRTREGLLERYGGIDGYNKHLDEDRPRLEKMGFHFVTEEEMEELKHRHDKSEFQE
jgi:hypothetical protein